MKHLVVLAWLMMSQAVFSQTIVVKSGDHPGFTRLVLELPQVTGWQMGRTDEGYELRIKGEAVRFDLSGVFNEIQRNRLAAIWMDPESGGLRLGVACACHAIPFEFRPGIIVVDLRDGPPPKGSSFELPLDGTGDGIGTPQLAARPAQRPRARPQAATMEMASANLTTPEYDWLASGEPDPGQRLTPDLAPPPVLVDEQHDVGPLKDALLRQLSQGAAQGIVQMAKPSLAARNTGNPLPIGPRANIRLGEVPGFEVTTQRDAEGTLIEDGAECISDERLDVASWGDERPAPMQLADARARLLGEFDRPDPDAVILATKLLIHLGFGVEARQLLSVMPIQNPDTVLWKSMAGLVDGGSDPTGPFAGMQSCNTAAALWAVMARREVSGAEKPRTQAVLRAFSALPAHLRRSLGPDLSARFLAVNDLSTARTISNAVQRSVTNPGPEIALMEAGLELAQGDPATAAAQLEPALADAGASTAETLIALVDAKIASGEAIDAQTPVVLAALVREQAGSDLEPGLRRAQILALGSSGDFDSAFALLPKMAEAETGLWQILAKSGSDTAILNHAVLPSDATLPALAAAERSQIASHLLALGLSDAALTWIGSLTEASTEEDRILAATASLSSGDPKASLAWTAGLEDNAALELRAKALWQLGKPDEAAKAWADAGNTEAELRAQSWARNWDGLSQGDASAWQAAAVLLTAEAKEDVRNAAGPLALGTALVADSVSARATLSALLKGVPGPASLD